MKVYHDSILRSLYASTALATLAPEHRATLLHPDHAAALKALIPDAVGILVARCTTYSLAVNFEEDSFEITSERPPMSVAFQAGVIPAVAAIILYIVRLAACDTARFPDEVVALLSAPSEPIIDTRTRIHRYRV